MKEDKYTGIKEGKYVEIDFGTLKKQVLDDAIDGYRQKFQEIMGTLNKTLSHLNGIVVDGDIAPSDIAIMKEVSENMPAWAGDIQRIMTYICDGGKDFESIVADWRSYVSYDYFDSNQDILEVITKDPTSGIKIVVASRYSLKHAL